MTRLILDIGPILCRIVWPQRQQKRPLIVKKGRDVASTKALKPKSRIRTSQGGFISVLHSLEEKFYGPDSPLPAIAKIALYLRHRSLRDWTKKKKIPKSEIIQATGVEKRCAERALKNLEKENVIQVTRSKVGKIWSDNTYELHPKRFGNDYIYRPDKPGLKLVVNKLAAKNHKKNKEIPDGKVIHMSDPSYPQLDLLPSDKPVGVPDFIPAGVPVAKPVGKGVKHMELLDNSVPKNPSYKEPIKRTLSEDNDSWIKTEKTEDELNNRKRILFLQAQQIQNDAR